MIVHSFRPILELPPSPVPRSQGVHISGIIRCIAVEMGVLKADTVDDARLADVRVITDPVAILRICIGLSWEDWYIHNILTKDGVIKHPGEMRVDSIHMTPDGESLETRIVKGKQKHVMVVHEVKATYKSVNTVGDLSSQWLWVTQAKCYCVGMQTRFARFHILHLCGDYKFPIKPDLICFDVEFTQKEIEDNWELMTAYRDARS